MLPTLTEDRLSQVSLYALILQRRLTHADSGEEEMACVLTGFNLSPFTAVHGDVKKKIFLVIVIHVNKYFAVGLTRILSSNLNT